MSSQTDEGALSFAEKMVDEALSAVCDGDASANGSCRDTLVKAVEVPKYEHIHCELYTEPAGRRASNDADNEDVLQDDRKDEEQHHEEREQRRDSSDEEPERRYEEQVGGTNRQEDGESGTEVPRDDSWEELQLVKPESADSSVRDSTSLDKVSMQEVESVDGAEEEASKEAGDTAPEVESDVSGGDQQTADHQQDDQQIDDHGDGQGEAIADALVDEPEEISKKPKKEKGFFSNMFKRKSKPSAPKEAASTGSKEPKSGLDKKKSRSSLFLFGSNTDLSTAGKSEPASPDTADQKPMPKEAKATTPQSESPTKSFFSFGGGRKKKVKKVEGSRDSDDGAAAQGNKEEVSAIRGSECDEADPDKYDASSPNEKVKRHSGEDEFVHVALGDASGRDMAGEVNEQNAEGGCGDDDDDDGGDDDDDENVVDDDGLVESADGMKATGEVPETKTKHRMFSIPQYFKRMTKMGDSTKKLKTQIWSSVVTIVLIEGKRLLPMDDNGFSDPYVKFRLGNERYKSKYKAKTLNPKWLEQFDLHMFDDQTSHLEISVWDHDTGGKDDIMGRAEIDLSTLDPEKTHALDVPLEDGAGIIRLLLSISGTSGSETISDLANYTPNPKERERLVRKYGVLRSFKGFRDIGWLQVKVIKAQGLASADIGGKSDPFCVLELVNTRLQTQTEYKTLNPEWGKVFTFNVKDIHSVLEVTVYDEDRDKKCEFLGKVSIPLLRVRPGERRWYQLKDRKLMMRARGAIQLEMDLIFNHFKAAVRTFNPREDKYMQPDPKFKLSVMKRNIDRVTKIVQAGVEAGKFLQSCFDWESKIRSILAFAVFLVIVWNFELYMVPLTLLIIFIKNLLVIHIVGNLMKDKEDDEYVDEEDDDEDDEKDIKAAKEEKKSFKEKLQAVQDVSLQVQEGMDMVASMGERVKNTFNWTVPWLSWLAVILLTIGVFVLYYVPLRYIIMAWGINKFTKKLRAPNAIPNNELLDFLSRVPSDKELIMYRELRPDPSTGVAKKKRA